MAYQSPQGLASLGRNGDSMLVHMSPSEVAGLQGLAMAQGGSLSVNPHTGLPEAFSLGGFFKGLLPMFAGMATGGAGMPLWAGIAAGAATGAVTSKDKLMGAITGGLGGYGGYNLGQGFAAAATPTTPTTATAGYVDPMTAVNATDVVKQGIANPLSGMNTGLQTQNLYPTNLLNQANASGFAGSAATGATGVDKSFLGGLNNMGPGVQNVGSGIKNVFTGKPGAFDAFKASFVEPGAKPISDLAAYGKIAMPIGGGVLSGLEPSDIYGKPINMAAAKEDESYDPYRSLRLTGDTGLRLVAKGGYIDGYAMGGTVTTGGLRDLYATTDTPTNPTLSRDGYGIGRLDNLARQESMEQARYTGYAMGGPVSFADGGDSNKLTDDNELIDTNLSLTGLNLTTPAVNTTPTSTLTNAVNAASTTGPSDAGVVAQVTNAVRNDPSYQPKNPIEEAIVKQLKGGDMNQSSQGIASLGAKPSAPMSPSYNPSVAMGPTYYAGLNAPRGYAEGGETSMNLDALPSLNVNTGTSGITSIINNDEQKFGGGLHISPVDFLSNMKLRLTRGTTPTPLISGYQPLILGKNAQPEPKSYALNLITGKREAQYAQGGYLNGDGDGMSDSIPATIEGKQPARLADGEFVVSADVVSHLGNGSTKAGAKKLYKMMDKVRLARTGNKKQGKQINADKFLPK